MSDGDTGGSLCLRDIDAAYGPFRALFGVSLELRPGRVTALLGANGAGKSTVARVASGLLRPTAGRVVLDGDDVTGLREWDLSRRGVGHVVEARSVFASLTVAENLVMAMRHRVRRGAVSAVVDTVYDRFPVLGQRRRQLAGTLSGGEQRLLSLAWAVVCPPRVLICDELSLGLAPMVTAEVYDALANVKSAGCALLIVEQETAHALALADELVVLEHGRVAYRGEPEPAVVDSIVPGASQDRLLARQDEAIDVRSHG